MYNNIIACTFHLKTYHKLTNEDLFFSAVAINRYCDPFSPLLSNKKTTKTLHFQLIYQSKQLLPTSN